jgi:DNA-binding phage protein
MEDLTTGAPTAAQRRAWAKRAGGINAVATRLGVSKQRLDRWLHRGVPHAWVVRVADALGVEPIELSPQTAADIVDPWVQGEHQTR